MTRPSAVSSTSPPRAVSSVARAARRSVSWPRRWATPRSRDGVAASAATAAIVGVSSPTSCRSTSTPVRVPGPRTTSPSEVGTTVAPNCSSTGRMPDPGLGGALGPAGDRDLPAGDRRGGEEHRRVRQVRFHRPVAAGDRARRDAPRVDVGVVDLHAGGRSIATDMSMCGSDGTGLPSWTTVTPFSYRAPDSSSPETNCDDSEASITTSPPGSAPVAATVNGSRSPSMRAPSALSASSTVPIGRSRARGSPSKRTGPSASAAAGGTKRMTVPASPQSTLDSWQGRHPGTRRVRRRRRARRPRRRERRGRAGRRPSARCRGWGERR